MERRKPGLWVLSLTISGWKAGGVLLGAGFAPLWWTVGQGQNTPLQRFYGGAFWTSLKTAMGCLPMANRFRWSRVRRPRFRPRRELHDCGGWFWRVRGEGSRRASGSETQNYFAYLVARDHTVLT